MINICTNIYITNKFLGGTFLTYGIEVFKYRQNRNYQFNQSNPMETIFPRLTKCDFNKYGPSGTIQNIDALCILAQNSLNDKIYLFLWVWFGVLAILSVFALIYRTTIIVQIIMKRTLLFNMFNFANNEIIMSMLVTKFQVRNLFLNFNFKLANLNKYNSSLNNKYRYLFTKLIPA